MKIKVLEYHILTNNSIEHQFTMPKNTKGGKHKYRKRQVAITRDVEFADPETQVYGCLKEIKGKTGCIITLANGKTMDARIIGKMWKKVYLYKDDYVLCDLNYTGENTCGIIKKYRPEELCRIAQDPNFGFTLKFDVDDSKLEEDKILEKMIRDEREAFMNEIDNISDSDSEAESDTDSDANSEPLPKFVPSLDDL